MRENKIVKTYDDILIKCRLSATHGMYTCTIDLSKYELTRLHQDKLLSMIYADGLVVKRLHYNKFIIEWAYKTTGVAGTLYSIAHDKRLSVKHAEK